VRAIAATWAVAADAMTADAAATALFFDGRTRVRATRTPRVGAYDHRRPRGVVARQ
jgi:thiamine biosynthesis lipoprotein ApbE